MYINNSNNIQQNILTLDIIIFLNYLYAEYFISFKVIVPVE